jgi:hypothetical protein
MSKNKKIIGLIFVLVLLFVGKYVYDMNINHNFETITEGKVYKSAVIPPDEIESYVKKYHIKSIETYVCYKRLCFKIQKSR